LSFFDEVDEPPTTPRAPRQTTRPRRPAGGGRPPGTKQAIRTRRAVAAALLLVVIVLMAIGIHACQVSQRNSALKDYNSQVYSLIASSDQTGAQLFHQLQSHRGDATALYTQIGETLTAAQSQLNQALAMNVPGEMQSAHDKLVLALTMRRDGIRLIGSQIQRALGTLDRQAAIKQLAAANATFYASDVVYKAYSVPEMVAALHAAGIPVGGLGGEAIQGGQFLGDLGWLQQSFIASKLRVSLPRGSQATSGLHGHSLNSVSVGGSQLVQGATNYVPSTPAPTFTLSLTNGGHYNEYHVECKVSVVGLGDLGTAQIAETTAGQTTTCQVTLPTSPPASTYNVTAEVVPVPGETNTANNYLTFPVKFTG
jgi:hypothetical protein